MPFDAVHRLFMMKSLMRIERIFSSFIWLSLPFVCNKMQKKMQDFRFEFGFIKHKILQNVVNLNADIELPFYTYMVALYLYIISSTAHAMLQITLCSLLHTCIPELCKMQMHWYTTMRVYKFMLATQGSKRNHQDIIRQKTICKRIYRCL